MLCIIFSVSVVASVKNLSEPVKREENATLLTLQRNFTPDLGQLEGSILSPTNQIAWSCLWNFTPRKSSHLRPGKGNIKAYSSIRMFEFWHGMVVVFELIKLKNELLLL